MTLDLSLSADPALRAKQVLNTLLAGPVDADARTLPPDAALLAFYILPDGTAVADFSEALSTSVPSGVQSEQLAVDSITRTLEANVPQIERLKILDSRTGSGYVGRASGLDANICGENQRAERREAAVSGGSDCRADPKGV